MSEPVDGRVVDVLLVEDNPDDARFVQRLLGTDTAASGGEQLVDVREVDHADTLAEGVELARSGEYDVVLLDLMLPDGEGLETLAGVTDEVPHVPIVVITGRTDAGLGPRAIRRGAQDYLRKGRITDDVLRRTIRYAVDRHEKQRALVEANHRLALLHRIVSQDVRNDVSTIVGWGAELEDRVAEEDHEPAERLLAAARHAADLVDTAGELTDALAVEGRPTPEPVDLVSIVEVELDRIRRRTDATVDAEWNGLDGAGVAVRGTPLLSSAFEQLLDNAVRHSDRESPTVEVAAASADDSIVVRVVDDGVGIPDTQRELLNDPETRYEDRSGLGTGLYLVTHVLDQVGGTVEFAASEPRGTEVTVTLPRADAG